MTHTTTNKEFTALSIDKAISEEKRKLFEMGYTKEDLDKLEKILEYASYPMIRSHFECLYH